MSVKLDLRNKLINGNFEYWQRGTSFSFATGANSAYTSDRFLFSRSGTFTNTVTQSSDVPAASNGLFSAQVLCTLAQATTPSYCDLVQLVEGNVLRSFKGKKMVLSFWVKSSKIGTYCISFRNGSGGSTMSLIKEYTILQANTWEKKMVRLQHNSSGAWTYTNAVGLEMAFNFVPSSVGNLVGVADSWQSGIQIVTSNQVNFMDTLNAVFKITDVCLVEDNEGQTREPDFMYAGRDVFEELQLCQRYYSKSFPLSVAPGASYAGAISAIATPNAYVIANIAFPAMMRISPIVSLIACDTGVPGWTLNGLRPTAVIQTTAERGFSVYNPYSVTASNGYFTSWTADAEL